MNIILKHIPKCIILYNNNEIIRPVANLFIFHKKKKEKRKAGMRGAVSLYIVPRDTKQSANILSVSLLLNVLKVTLVTVRTILYIIH